MDILKNLTGLFRTQKESESLNSGEFITKISDGANLVDDKQTWEHAEEGKDDIVRMKKCCDAEIQTSLKTRIIPAPFYFRRVAILSRKNKDYEQEIYYCEAYLQALARVTCEQSSVQVAALSDWFIKRKNRAEFLSQKHQEKRG